MSTQTPAPQPQPAVPRHKSEKEEIKIVSHSNLFYWWPLWAVGFLMALLTFVDGHFMAVVPKHTDAYRDAMVDTGQQTLRHRDVLVAPEGHHLPPEQTEQEIEKPRLMMAENKAYGVWWTVVLLLLIVITNVPLRGLWSVMVIVVIVFLVIIASLAGWVPRIMESLFKLHIHINLAGYLVISLALLVIWLVTLLFFDPQIYIVFTPGQMRVRQEIGGGETAYPTAGIVLQKQRNDLFRHWILGLGSGDLIVTTSGAAAHHFDLPNVLFVGYKVHQIEDMLRDLPTVQG